MLRTPIATEEEGPDLVARRRSPSRFEEASHDERTPDPPRRHRPRRPRARHHPRRDIAPNASPPRPSRVRCGRALAYRADPIDHVTDEDPVGEGSPTPSFPRAGETMFRIAEFPPDSVYPAKRPRMRSSRRSTARPRPQDGTKHCADKHFWFHRTDSLDYAIVLEGEITLLVDEGEATLKAGDVAIQRATSHAWSNRTDRIARVAFVLIGTEPLSADEIARQRRELSVRAG